ncbi:MAG TPA: DUF5672 family protein [Anaeromyxobacteraceae bacterium]|nr:DUF5672 family protein [Anaeromyxobacteraceae bacterium]
MTSLPREQLSIVVPIHRSSLELREEVSLDSTFRLLGGHHLVMVKPDGLDTSEVERRYRFGGVETFEPAYFASVQGYNRLLLSTGFYQRFLGSRFVLICQPDVFVFRDDLSRWVERGYDYVGAPWVSGNPAGHYLHWVKMRLSQLVLGVQDKVYRFETRNRVGNGGFSLRSVATHHRLSIEMKGAVEHYLRKQGSHHFNEDIFWSIEPRKRGFPHSTPSLQEALSFSFDINPERLFRMAGRRLPMAAHGWYKRDRLRFWEPHVEAARAGRGPPRAPPTGSTSTPR